MHSHHRLDHSRLRFQPTGEQVGDLIQPGVVRNPRTGVDPAGADQFYNSGEIWWKRISTCEQGHLPAVHEGMAEVEFAGRDSDVHEASGKSDVLQCLTHRTGMAGGVNDAFGEAPMGQFFERFEIRSIRGRQDGVRHAHRVADECEALRIEVHHHGASAGEFGEFDHGEANGTCADDDDCFTGLAASTIYGVAADGECFDECGLFRAQGWGRVQLLRGKEKLGSHAAIGMDSEHLQVFAAVDVASLAGMAFPAVEVGLDGTPVSGVDAGYSRAHGEDFHAEFVSGNARITVKRHFPEIPTEVGTANPDAMHLDERFAGAGWSRGWQLNETERLGFLEL